MTDRSKNPSEGAKMSFSDDMSYGDYLKLDQILAAQNPLSDAHDEMLFIIQHQTSELWMRLALVELEAARKSMRGGALPQAFKMLTRVARIFEQLNNAWDVLRTMTPSEYTRFRAFLGQSSGFQSHQYRQIEFILGNRNPAMMKLHEHRAASLKILQDELGCKSLYHEAIALLYSGLGVEMPSDRGLRLDCPHAFVPEIQVLWQQVYESSQKHWALYELAEKLVDLEDYFRRWRFNHVTTVERIIGFKRGTGGTSGVDYLRKMLEIELFPELWRVRGEL